MPDARLVACSAKRIAGIGADLPVLRDHTDFQILPSCQIRARFSALLVAIHGHRQGFLTARQPEPGDALEKLLGGG